MRVVIIDEPLKSIEPSGLKGLASYLNVIESKLRARIPDINVEVIDLSETFDLGQRAEFIEGAVEDWKGIPVF